MDGRVFLEAVLWIARTGSLWRDLPPSFGKWSTVFKRYRDWVKADVFKRIFDAVTDDPDIKYAMVDATIIKVHRQHWQEFAGSKRGTQNQAIGQSRAGKSRGGKSKTGMTTKACPRAGGGSRLD